MNRDLEILLESWEGTYKKGQLTFWIFLGLKEAPKYVDEIKEFVETASSGTMTCEEQSLYRNLRKFQHVKVVDFELKKGFKGPDRKYYYLTKLGEELFEKFVDRNIRLFLSPHIQDLLNKKN